MVTKDRLHLLFVVSRPDDAGFLDPRADTLPVLDAIEKHAPGRVSCEFLRPPTLDALLERLEDKSKPAVDILHFDGHGVFDRQGGLPERATQRQGSRFPFEEVAVKQQDATNASPPNTGYLLFETSDGKCDLVSAAKLGSNLHRHNVALVILSACQSAAVAEEPTEIDESERADAEKSPMGSVAARLTATGIPSVLAMTHSVLVYTTRALFSEFYKELARSKGIGEALDNARRYLANHPKSITFSVVRIAFRSYFTTGSFLRCISREPIPRYCTRGQRKTISMPPSCARISRQSRRPAFSVDVASYGKSSVGSRSRRGVSPSPDSGDRERPLSHSKQDNGCCAPGCLMLSYSSTIAINPSMPSLLP